MSPRGRWHDPWLCARFETDHTVLRRTDATHGRLGWDDQWARPEEAMGPGQRRPIEEDPVTEAVIVATTRTPIGRAFKGSLKQVRPDDLSVQVVRGLLDQLP